LRAVSRTRRILLAYMDLLKLSVGSDGSLSVAANIWVVIGLVLILALLMLAVPRLRNLLLRDEYEIDEIELGIGSGKVKLKPNSEDLQIAYRLWVELNTRKLGLLFDEEHDVISEVYTSWYEFFRVTRELVKAIPISKIRGQDSTRLFVGIAIDVLNKGIRPHLTKWQARYRRWYETQLQKTPNPDISPQDLQRHYPQYAALVQDLKKTNRQLMAYGKMLACLLELEPVTQ
jgi:hypothetical protein